MADDPKVLLGTRIRLIREGKGISQESLADLADVHRTYMGKVERGELSMSVENLIKIARALKVLPSALIDNLK